MNDRVRQFYQTNPYPAISRFATVQIPARYFENYCFQLKKNISNRPEILIIGCGTAAPAAIASRYPDAQIICALDISEKTIEIAKTNIAKKLREKIVWVNADFESEDLINKLPASKFDWIHCTGVLHHLSSPEKGISNLSKVLKDEGLIRFQIYSKGSRIWIEWLRRFFRLHNVTNTTEAKRLLLQLPSSHPFRFVLATYPESINDSGLNDGFLHPQVNTYCFSEWQKLFNMYNLEVSIIENLHYLDDIKEIFPEKLIEPINNLTLHKKVTLLERLGEWRSDFKGILTKANNKTHFNKSFQINQPAGSLISQQNISYPRMYIWQEAKSAIKDLNIDICERDFKKILDSLSPRCWLTFPMGLMMRLKWSAWNDLSRQLASSNIIFKENIDSLLCKYKENENPISIPPSEEWPWEQWEKGFHSWQW